MKDNSQFDEQGTEISGWSDAGPFHCEDCKHLDSDNACRHPKVMIDKKIPDYEKRKLSDGRILIFDIEHECCKYVRQQKDRKEEKEESKDASSSLPQGIRLLIGIGKA